MIVGDAHHSPLGDAVPGVHAIADVGPPAEVAAILLQAAQGTFRSG